MSISDFNLHEISSLFSARTASALGPCREATGPLLPARLVPMTTAAPSGSGAGLMLCAARLPAPAAEGGDARHDDKLVFFIRRYAAFDDFEDFDDFDDFD